MTNDQIVRSHISSMRTAASEVQDDLQGLLETCYEIRGHMQAGDREEVRSGNVCIDNILRRLNAQRAAGFPSETREFADTYPQLDAFKLYAVNDEKLELIAELLGLTSHEEWRRVSLIVHTRGIE